MEEVNSIQVTGLEEGYLLISYLTVLEAWVSPLVYEIENSYYVKAAMSTLKLEEALIYIRS